MLENFGTSKRDKSSGFYESQQSPHDKYWTIILLWRKRINIGHLFYYGERDQYWTIILLWRRRINIGHYYFILMNLGLQVQTCL